MTNLDAIRIFRWRLFNSTCCWIAMESVISGVIWWGLVTNMCKILGGLCVFCGYVLQLLFDFLVFAPLSILSDEPSYVLSKKERY